jgi:hypothetical protein
MGYAPIDRRKILDHPLTPSLSRRGIKPGVIPPLLV